MIRVIFALLFELVLSVAFAIFFAGIFLWWQGETIAESFHSGCPASDPRLHGHRHRVFAIFLIIGGIRRRGVGWSIGGTFLAALIGALVNLVWIAILSAASGGTIDPAAMLLGVQAGAIFVIAATIATIGVRRIIRIPSRKAPETPPTQAAA